MNQWVCTACGYNMIGEMPEVCPFCGAGRDRFLDWEEAEKIYRVTPTPVVDRVTQLTSVPKLGLEHAAYRIELEKGAVWIDCPSAFNRNLEPVDAILFTHLHFMGASNQYRKQWNAKIFLHARDAVSPLVESFPVDERFTGKFRYHGIEALPVGGHTPGFTVYIYQSVLFVCDYAFPPGDGMRLNPHGPPGETRQGAEKLFASIRNKSLSIVCGYNYTAGFHDWLSDFDRILRRN
ncbi:MAG: rubredoxin-like domain-containing protein [Gammaproteobacteria bacterium]